MAPLPARHIEPEIEAVVEEGATLPRHVYAIYRDAPPAPALYLEVDVGDPPSTVSFVVHNFRYYELGMDRWDVGVVELLVLNELHELTHWAMTADERTALDERSHRAHRGDGYWLNPALLDVIDWLSDDYTFVVDRDVNAGPVVRLRRWLRWTLARLGR